MLNYKILVKISGSIAAYKSAYLISKLVQNGFEVQTAASKSALKFIGEATLEGLTGKPVFSDIFETGKIMSHINLAKWADLTILTPATGNTINKLANGIADNLITSLFLAHIWEKPYLIAPAMNVNMFNHPATQVSLKKLKEWGVVILPTEVGHLACGDTGKGKLLDPDKIYTFILNELNKLKSNSEKMKLLITSGGTKENIDGIRFLTNLSTGKTGASLADWFFVNGHNVTLIKAEDAVSPIAPVNTLKYNSFNELESLLKLELSKNNYDAVIHLSAVSDYSLSYVETENKKLKAPLNEKIDSSNRKIKLVLKANYKIVNKLKNFTENKNLKIVSFKFISNDINKISKQKFGEFFKKYDSDYIVFNSLNDRKNGIQTNFKILCKNGDFSNSNNVEDLSKNLEKLLTEQG